MTADLLKGLATVALFAAAGWVMLRRSRRVRARSKGVWDDYQALTLSASGVAAVFFAALMLVAFVADIVRSQG